MVRKLLAGTFANTAFCIFNPHGTKKLSRSARSPASALRTRRGRGNSGDTDDDSIIRQMEQIVVAYSPTDERSDRVLQDFNTLRQALNVASADQRLLIVVNADEESRLQTLSTLKTVLSDAEVEGKFHLATLKNKTDDKAAGAIKGFDKQPSISIVRAGKFGLDGTLIEKLPPTASAEELKTALLTSNQLFAELENRKTYSDHVRDGKRQRIYFENEIPYGEDRDGDGEIDKKRGRS